VKRWQAWVAALALAILLAVAGIYLAYRWWLAEPVAASPELEVACVQRGPMVATVKAVGVVAAPSTVVLNFSIGGRLTALNVAEGDVVQAGDVLARLDTTELELKVAQAEAVLELSQAQLARVEAGASEAEIAAAEASLLAAQARYEQLRSGPLAAELASAEAALKSAEVSYQRLLAGPTEDELTAAKADLEKAEIALQAAQTEYDKYAWRQGFEASPQAVALHQATIDYQRALANYHMLMAGPAEDELARAQAQIAQARAQLEKLRASPAAELRGAAAEVARAQAELDRLRNSPTPEELAIMRAQVHQAEIALEQARQQLDYAMLVAPCSGTVVDVAASVGQRVSSAAPVITLADLSHLQVEVGVNEIDVGKVQVGQRAAILLDAFPAHRLEGRVSRVAPQAEVTAGGGNYQVTVELGESDVAVKPGMTAQTEIIIYERADALQVPRAALRPEGEGWVVWVRRDGRVVGVEVEVGQRQGRAVEVRGDLAEGEEVVIGTFPSQPELKRSKWLP